MVNTASRIVEPELMDDPRLDPDLHRCALDGLGRINRISRAASSVWRPIRTFADQAGLDTVRVLDIATGGGDLPIGLWQSAKLSSHAFEFTGGDISPVAIDHARRKAARFDAPITFEHLDVIHDAFPTGFDVVTCSLFLHHLERDTAVALLRRLYESDVRLVVISDLRRCRSGFVAAWIGCRLLSRSHVVHVDGPQSVRAAFSVREANELAREGLTDQAHIERCWPWRWMMTWSRQ